MKIKIKQFHIVLWITLLTLVSLACGSLEVGIVTPTSADTLINAEATQEPITEMGISLTPEENVQPTEAAKPEAVESDESN